VPNVKYFGALTYPDPLGHLDGLLLVTFIFFLGMDPHVKEGLKMTCV
jgi:hypothetical protein